MIRPWLPQLALLALAAGARSQAPLFLDTFAEYEHGRYLGLTWQSASGDWDVKDGRLVGRSNGRGVCWASASPASADQELSVLVTPRERLAPRTWAAASLALWSSEADFWRIALVEGPDGRRYGELVEMRRGQWQAQNEAATHLEPLPSAIEGFAWEFGHAYRYRLTVSPESIVGEIIDDATGAVGFRKGYALPASADAVRRGRPALLVDAMDAAFDNLRVLGRVDQPSGGPRRVAVLDTGMPDSSPQVLALIRNALSAGGIDSTVLPLPPTPGEFTVRDDVALLVLPHTRRLPLGVVPGVDRYLRRGGSVIFCGGPLAEETLVRREDQWLSLTDALASVPTERVFADFGAEPLDAWQRHHGPDEAGSEKVVEKSGPPGGGRALRVHVEDLRGWDTLARALETSPFGDNQTLTCFWAKGEPRTTHLTIEWQETDGSRWMTAVPLTRQWRRYVLTPQDLAYWPDNPAVGRGGAGDRFHPEKARLLAFGLAKSHSPLPDGPHTYWIADLGVAKAPFALAGEPPPIIEAVSPTYKTYAPSGAREIVSAAGQAVVAADLRLPPPPDLRCPIYRTRGLGLQGARMGRWIPLLIARDGKGRQRGCAASLFISATDPYPNAAWGILGTEDPEYLCRNEAVFGPVMAAMARRLLDGVWLAKAGSDQFSYLPDQRPILGGQVANRSASARELRLHVSVRPETRDTVVFDQAWPISAPPGVLTGMSGEWSQAVEPGVYRARVELLRGGEVLDVISHEFVRLPKPSADASDFVTVSDGDFRLGTRPWHPHGINYWPSNATALEPAAYWLHWLHPSNYDPEVIDRDLQALADLKINSVSIALGGPEQLPACLHFLYRCSQHGIRANVYVGGGDPVGFNVDRVLDLIRAGDLANNSTIWAWDIAWEPHFGAYEARQALDGRWADWIVERYGSVANAERDWRFAAPRKPDGSLTGPSQEQITTDGDHRVMVAAYRRFLDDLVSDSYGRWARAVRAVDPRHLIGVRSGYGGTGQPGIDPQMPFDLLSGAKHLDFVSPEGYGLGGPWESFEQGGFTTAYARYTGGGKPVFWAEFGLSVYPGYSREQLEAQRLLYEHLYRMVTWSGASGSAGWWFPGGFRVGENSDFGIVNPDGTPRPSALEARKWADRIARAPKPPQPNYTIAIDRDLHPRGYSQVWLTHRDEYVQARRGGLWVAVRTEGMGTDSTNAPMVAVGNTQADGSNPPKYLNAEFNFVRVRAGGEWTEVAPGASIDVPVNRRVELVASVGNTGEALWVGPARAGAKPGGVYLVSVPGSALSVIQPLPVDVPRYADGLVGPFVLTDGVSADTPVALRLEAKGRTPFGAHFRFTLRPAR
jgi:hypothetical protein